MKENSKLKILFASAEVSPFAKTGGLADVAGSLPSALKEMGCDVRIAMPRYRQIDFPMEYETDFSVDLGAAKKTCIVRKSQTGSEENDLPVYFIDSYDYYDRDGIYCFYDDADRFAFFCISMLEMLPAVNFKPDIIHCNDWHTGPVCMLLEEKYKNREFYSGMSTVYTIHNLKYQGNFPREVFGLFNLDENAFNADKSEFYGMFSFMKSGLMYASKINTVSAVYAKEIQTPEYGEGMDGILKSRATDLFGILNGIGYSQFNPGTDPNILENYTADTFEKKYENKKMLQKELGLPMRDLPVAGIVSRLSGQKGLDLILEKSEEMMKEDMQFVLLGTGDPYYENEFTRLSERHPCQAAVKIGFDAVLAQKIYAGCDMFLMPSRFEPCGLGQLISFRYGTIPVVRATGGLAETVTDYDTDNERGNGFSFTGFSSEELMDALKRALDLYSGDKSSWKELAQRVMKQDYSWQKSALRYIDLYRLAAQGR